MEKKDLENLFDEVVATVKDGLNRLAQKTDQLTQIGRIKLDIVSIKRDIEKQFSELGGRVYELWAEKAADNPLEDEQVKNYLSKVEELHKQLEAKKEELEKVSQQEAEKQSQEQATASEETSAAE